MTTKKTPGNGLSFLSDFHKLITAVMMVLLASCTTYQPYFSDPEAQSSPSAIPADSITYSVFLIGDLAHLSKKKQRENPLLPLFKDAISDAGKNSSVVFLGDNLVPDADVFDPAGLIPLMKDYPGKRFFLPGNLEWSAEKPTKNLRKLEKKVDEEVDLKDIDVFVPDDACSGPETEDLTEDIAVVAYDSQWWLENWNRDPAINGKCEYKDRDAFMIALREELKGMKDKTVILAAHHPLYANGPKGGNYSLRQHLFPLTDISKNLYIPLPGLGSIYYWFRTGAGFPDELSHPNYRALTNGLQITMGKDNDIIMVGAHEHVLQYNTAGNRHHIVSGTGTQADPIRRGKDAEFAYGRQGFSKIVFPKDGSVWLQFYALDKSKRALELVYQQRMIEDRFAPKEAIVPPIPVDSVIEDSVEVSIYGGDYNRDNQFYEFVFGKRYRSAYYHPIRMPRVHLDTIYGNLKPYKRGGGQQTQSIRLRNSTDKEFAMRSIRKNPILLLPNQLRESFAVDLLKDQFTAAHPFAAFTVPKMADAVGVYHTNPFLAYVPKHRALGEYNDTYGGEAYMIEERPDENWEELASFGNAKEMISTTDVWETLFEDWDKRVDQEAFIRARLFDALLGDWDRHSDQWRWKVNELENGRTTYLPIPRDRDQVFSDYDGFVARAAALLAPGLRKMHPFNEDIFSPKWGNDNGRRNDRLMLNELEWEDWKKQAERIQQNLTDDIIESAIRDMPPEIYVLNGEGERITEILKVRRGKLLEYAREFYLVRAEHVDVVGTNKRDYFEIEYLPDGNIRVAVYDQSDDGDKDELYYERTFLPEETDEVRIYGLDGDDKYRLSGKNNSKILLRLVGDIGEDSYDDEAERAGGKKALIYEDPQGYDWKDDQGNLRLKASNIRERNQYDLYQYEQDYTVPFPQFGFDPDNGLYVGAGLHRRTFGYKKTPYKQDHKIAVGVSTRTEGINIDYTGDFIEFFGYRNDLLLDATYESPNFVVNYFGMGNESKNPVDEFSFNRVRRRLLGFYPSLKHRFRSGSVFTIGPFYERIALERTPGRFITEPTVDLPERLFTNQEFSGIDSRYTIASVDNKIIPTQGLILDLNGGWKTNLQENDRDFYYINSELRFYQRFMQENFLFATRIGFSHVEGEYDFFQAPNLGGIQNLRGYRTNRFYGNTVYYHNTDLRFPLLPIKSKIVPVTLGLYTGFDYGRVWLEGEDSDVWHYAYGGGLVVAPLNTLVLTAGLFRSPEGNRFTLRLGFDF